MSKANAFAALMKEAKGHGVPESSRQDTTRYNRLPHKSVKGKRDHTDYGKIGVYIRMETIADVKTRLIRERKDLSDLVQELLEQWIEKQSKP